MPTRANLKDANIYGENSAVYINQSLCPEFAYLSYAVRKAKKNNEIIFYKLRNGVNFIQNVPNGKFIEISHVNDLERYGISVPPRRY